MKESQEALIEAEYKIWRKNVPFIYDMVYTQVLKWPSPSIQWFPDVQRQENHPTTQRLLLTTYTAGAEKEHLIIAGIGFPDMVDEDCLNNADIKFKVNQSIPMQIDINRARYCPLASNIIACRTEKSDILVYDYTKHSSANSSKGPDQTLKGHKDGGFAIDWNHHKFGELATGGRDCLVNIFDINQGLISSKSSHTDIVNDLTFSSFNPNIFCSVSDDLRLIVNDTRDSESPIMLEKAHKDSIESVSFSPFKAELVATGSNDTSVKIWDIRSLGTPLYTLRGHTNGVLNVKWSPHYESVLASSSKDRRVIIWDLNRTDLVSRDESPELLFVHGGHMDVVDDFDWNPAEPMEIASVSADNLLHVWKISIEEYI
jgi:histone-binding protein RBBP4